MTIDRQLGANADLVNYCIGGKPHVSFRVPRALDWSQCQSLGSGAYGSVWQFHDQGTQRPVAVKKLRDAFSHPQKGMQILREVQVLVATCHENIVKMHFFYFEQLSKRLNIYIVQECADCDLDCWIQQSSRPEEHHTHVLFSIAHGMSYLHGMDVAHFDLKPKNILVFVGKDDSLKSLKICDFNHARVCRQGQLDVEDVELSGCIGTQPYIAPEVMLFQRRYDKSADIWSIGCTYGEIFKKRPLFPGSSDEDQIARIIQTMGFPKDYISNLVLRDKFGCSYANVFRQNMQHILCSLWDAPSSDWQSLLPGASSEAVDIIASLLQFDPMNRITAVECFKQASQMHHHTRHAMQDELPQPQIDWSSFDDPAPTHEHLHRWLASLSEWVHVGKN